MVCKRNNLLHQPPDSAPVTSAACVTAGQDAAGHCHCHGTGLDPAQLTANIPGLSLHSCSPASTTVGGFFPPKHMMLYLFLQNSVGFLLAHPSILSGPFEQQPCPQVYQLISPI